jgi:predicted permease
MVSIRYALRQLRRSPGFSLTVILTVALGVGANTAIFTLIHALLLKSLPVTDPKSLYRVGDRPEDCCAYGILNEDGSFSVFSYDLYRYLRDNTPEFEQLAAMQANRSSWITVRRGSEPARILEDEFVSGNYFSTFGIRPFAGRLLSDTDDVPGAPPVAVISYAAWEEWYGGDPAIIGSTFYVAAKPVTIIGITPPGFFGDRIQNRAPALWVPLTIQPILYGEMSDLYVANNNFLYIVGRLKPGTSTASLQDKMSNALRHWLETQSAYTANGGSAVIPKQHVVIVPAGRGIQRLQQGIRSSLYLSMSLSGLLLLIACVNIANLLLARGLRRNAETSIRIALGAGRGRLIQQFLTESVVLSCLGGLAGLVVATAATRTILSLMFPTALHLPIQTSASLPILAFAFLVSLVTGIGFGIAPAWITSRSDPAEALRGLGRATGGEAVSAQKCLIVLQAALSVILLIGASLLTKSLNNLQHQAFGIQTANRYVLLIDPFGAGYTREQLPGLNRTLEQRFGSIPGVQTVALANYTAMQGLWDSAEDIIIEGRPNKQPGQRVMTYWDRVSPGYFEVVGQPILRGRGFTKADTDSSRLVAVVNQSFVKVFFPNENPIGRHFGISDQKYAGAFEIVGVVADAKYGDASYPFRPMYFRPLEQYLDLGSLSAAADERSSLYVGAIALLFRNQHQNVEKELRKTLEDVDPKLAIYALRSFDDQVALHFVQERMIARLTILFGALALTLACIGLYGITSYTVARRTSEIGLRMALGADRPGVLRLVMRGAFAPVFIGLAVGLPVALLGARLIADQLYKVRPYDPPSIVIAVAVLSVAAGLAGFIPARRAATIDPMQALRME